MKSTQRRKTTNKAIVTTDNGKPVAVEVLKSSPPAPVNVGQQQTTQPPQGLSFSFRFRTDLISEAIVDSLALAAAQSVFRKRYGREPNEEEMEQMRRQSTH